MRQQETAKDRANEQAMKENLERRRYTVYKLIVKGSHEGEFMLMHGDQLRFWVEYKRRYNHSSKYKTFMVALAKWQVLKRYAEDTGRPAFFIIEYDNETLVYEVTGEAPGVDWGGREDRGNPLDKEPMVFIPVERGFGMDVIFGRERPNEGVL
jgi:hypothetical protein